MSWLNLNDSLSNLKGQITSFANNVLADDTNGTDIANGSSDELQKLCVSQQEEINKLRILNQELASGRESRKTCDEGEPTWSWDVPEVGSNDAASETIIPALRKKIAELESENKELAGNLVLLDSDFQQNTEKLVSMKDRLQSDYNNLEDRHNELVAKRANEKKELENLRNKLVAVENGEKICDRCEELLVANRNLQRDVDSSAKEVAVLTSNNATFAKILEDTQGIVAELQNKSKLVEDENCILAKEVRRSNETIRDFETKCAVNAENFKKLSTILEEYEQKVSSLKAELEERKATSSDDQSVSQLKEEVEDLKKKLLEVGEETHRRYVNILIENVKRYVDSVRPSDLQLNNNVDVNVAEFSHQVENIMKILLDLQCKCESLEKEVYNIAQEKTDLLTEKNHEIEKLLQNSEILSQEVITKTQTIKDYESECGELIKNNDILINELEQYKTNSGLQTISESNEDNLLMLETQLDNANRRIDELELLIAKRDNALIEEVTMEMQDLEGIQAENVKLTGTIDELEKQKRCLEEEREKLNVAFEKIKVDMENTEYQYTEVQVNVEALKEELENQKKKVDELIAEKSLLEKQNMDIERNNEDVRTELNVVREKLLLEEDANKHLQNQIRNATEKLQHAKMNETTMKLQFDTISKELGAATEAKMALEANFKSTHADLGRCLENYSTLQNEHDQLQRKLQEDALKIEKLEDEKTKFENFAVDESGDLLNNLHLSNDVKTKMEIESSVFSPNLEEEIKSLREENNRLAIIEQLHSQCSDAETKLEQLVASKNELTNVIITKHQENVAYHNEIQRLSQILTLEVEKSRNLELQLQQAKTSSIDVAEWEKLRDQNGFLRQKCEVLAENLLKEQAQLQQIMTERSGVSEKEVALSKKLERLQSHLIEIEDHYTQELLKAEERNADLQSKVNEIEQREKNSSTMYTSVSIRANQHVETLQHQLQLITGQRDELRKKISDAEDLAGKQAAALANLQFVLEQFQKDKEKDVQSETERIRRQISAEKRVQDELRREISSLQSQLEESKQGLLAASRLSDQLEQSKHQVTALKTEVSQLKEELSKSESKLTNLSSQTEGKVDKSLIKNLVIGLVSTNNNLNKDQKQILKIIATVLDFNQQDHDKVELNKPQQGWLGSLLAPQTSQGISQESLSQAFVKFLENESKPRVVPSLLNNNTETASSRKSSTATNPRQSPLVLAEVVLPTFADFAQNRNSSSILKDVLKDNS